MLGHGDFFFRSYAMNQKARGFDLTQLGFLESPCNKGMEIQRATQLHSGANAPKGIGTTTS